MKKQKSIKRICYIAILSALASVLYNVPKFSLPWFPSFLEINFSMLPIIIAAFMLGPIDGSIAVIIRCIIKFTFWGSGTQGVGEISDLILGLACVLTSGYAYRMLKEKKHSDLISIIIMILTWIITSIISNWLVVIPLYVKLLFDGNMAPLVGMCSIIKGINQDNFMGMYLLYAVVPFNALISISIGLITYLVNKRIKVVYNQFE